MRRKYLSLQQAEDILPELQQGIRKLMHLKKAIDLLDSVDLEFDDYHYEHNLVGLDINRKYHSLSHEFYRILIGLETQGCIVKDLDVGLVDFYSKHIGRDILLCWSIGEKKIQYWHEEEDGYSGRKHIDQLKKETASRVRKA